MNNYSGDKHSDEEGARTGLLDAISSSDANQNNATPSQMQEQQKQQQQQQPRRKKQYFSTHSVPFFLKKTHDVHDENCDLYGGRGRNSRSQRQMNINYRSISQEDGDDEDDHANGKSHESSGTSANNNSSNNNNHNTNNSNRTTDGQTMMHILKANIGTGILAMPSAFKNVGLWLGFILVPLIGSVCIHCMNILISSHNCLCDRFNFESLDYDQVAALSLACGPRWIRPLARRAQLVVTIFLLLTQMGFCCVYVMFVVENLQLALYNLFHMNYSTTAYLFMIFPVIWLTSCTSNLNHLARISTLANILQFIGLSLILFDLLQFHTYASRESSLLYSKVANKTSHSNYSSSSSPSISSNMTTSQQQQPQLDPALANSIKEDSILAAQGVQVFSWPESWLALSNGLPLFFATAVYAFEGIGVVLPLIKEMRYPEHISGTNGVLNTGMRLVAILYMAIGFFGYSKYGHTVEGSITLNLPETSLNEVIRLVFALGIGLSYSLQFYVPWTIVWPWIDEGLFYSYRPREENRDKKLNFQSKLESATGCYNNWDLDSNDEDEDGDHCDGEGRRAVRNPGGGESNFAEISASHQSNASTFATSYMVTSHKWASDATGAACFAPIASGAPADGAGVGTADATQDKQQCKFRRNRLDDVAEQEGDSDHIPQLEWRPPPRSMRGKRKLVRYTVIFFGVSLTFIFAALIPRLDLFISLIGALASSCLAIIFPAIIELCTFWVDPENESSGAAGSSSPTRLERGLKPSTLSDLWSVSKRSFFITKNILLIIFGLLGLVTGGWQSLSRLFNATDLKY